MNILIIDDCLPILNALGVLLSLYDYKVELSADERYLLDDTNPIPDLILTDYHIPDIDGFNRLQELKHHPRFKKIPIILMSGDINIEHACMADGVSDFIAKPIEMPLLLKKIEQLLRR